MPANNPYAYLTSNPYYAGAPYTPPPQWMTDALGRKARAAAYYDPNGVPLRGQTFTPEPAYVPDSSYRPVPFQDQVGGWTDAYARMPKSDTSAIRGLLDALPRSAMTGGYNEPFPRPTLADDYHTWPGLPSQVVPPPFAQDRQAGSGTGAGAAGASAPVDRIGLAKPQPGPQSNAVISAWNTAMQRSGFGQAKQQTQPEPQRSPFSAPQPVATAGGGRPLGYRSPAGAVREPGVRPPRTPRLA